jgi:broad specificity phosphatase PhoE
MGIFQGLTLSEMRDQFKQERENYERIGFEYVIPGGESARQRLERSVRIMMGLAERHIGESVVVVTHGGFLMGFFEFVLGMKPGNGWRFMRCNGGYSVFQYLQGKWCLETWNDTSHLDGLG